MRILVVDDDKRLCSKLIETLNLDRYIVDGVHDGVAAKNYMDTYEYDLLVLDWMLPGMTGIELCTHARANQFAGGILMLTAKDNPDDIILGLDKGADDYMVKPFRLDELLARVRAILRRHNKVIEQEIVLGPLKLNKAKKCVFIDNIEISLTRNEYLLLEYLLQHKGQVLTHDQIINYIWDVEESATSNALAALIRLVRKKIDVDDEPSYIESVRGIGYKMRNADV